MNSAEIKGNIVSLLENIVQRTGMMEKQSDERNLLELDLAMEDVRYLYREMESLRYILSEGKGDATSVIQDKKPAHHASFQQKLKTNAPKEVEQSTTSSDENHSEEKKSTPHSEKQTRKSSEDLQDAEKQKPLGRKEPPSDARKIIDTPVNKEQEQAANSESGQQTPPDNPPAANDNNKDSSREGTGKVKKSLGESMGGKKILGEQLSPETASVYERLSKIREDHSIGSRMQQKPIDDLKSAIGINEKFLFINELFNGDIKSYNESIHRLNQLTSIHDAFGYLNELTTSFQWDGERSADTIEKFANLVQRRFMS